MLANHFKTALRNIIRQYRSISLNIIGLCVAMACCVITAGWAFYEYGYDRFHTNANDIYRILERNNTTGKLDVFISYPLAKALKDNFPEVIRSAGYSLNGKIEIMNEGMREKSSSVKLDLYWTDAVFFEMFDFRFLKGNRYDVFARTNSIVISNKTASSLFGNDDAMGKTILVGKKRTPYYISGIIDDIPENSSLVFDAIINTESILNFWESEYNYKTEAGNWDRFVSQVFVQLNKNTSSDIFNNKIKNIIQKYKPNYSNSLLIQPLTDMHLSELPFAVMDFGGDKELKLTSSQINLFIGIALVILIIACINFINLSLASAIKRAKEIGIRKVSGASRKDIIFQHITESFVLSVIAVIAGFILANLLLPAIRELTGKEYELSSIPLIPFLLSLTGIVILTTIIAGLYPAVISSLQNPVNIIRKQFFKNKFTQVFLRDCLIVIQFATAGLLLFVTLAILFQLDYNRNKDLGFDKNNVVLMDINTKTMNGFVPDLEKYSQVENIAYGMPPTFGESGHKFGNGRSALKWEGKDPNQKFMFEFIFASANYANTLGIKIKAGRFFEKDRKSDTTSLVINETAAGEMKLSNPIGARVKLMGKEFTIIGIVKDYHLGTLKSPISPAIYQLIGEGSWGLIVKLRPNQFAESIKYINKLWKKHSPDKQLNLKYLDEQLELNYISDSRLFKIVIAYAILSIIVACSGLLSLVVLHSEEKRKEIGIRKVLGASSMQINYLLNKEYILLVGIALLIAFPLGFHFVMEWLDSYAYRISINANMFLISGGIILLSTLLTLNYHTIKAVNANPVDSLKYE